MRYQPTEAFTTRSSSVDAQEHVSAEVRRRPLPEDGRLDFMQIECRCWRRRISGGSFMNGHRPTILQGRPLSKLVEEFLNRLAEALQASGLRHRQIGICNVPSR